MRIAVTGGAGYIGSHTVAALLSAEHDVLILDNFANADADVPARIEKLTGRAPEVARLDITDPDPLNTAMQRFAPDAVIHFAGLKAVGEAVAIPVEYHRVNVGGSIALFDAMQKCGCRRVVFSSSATVYGDPQVVPIPETHALDPANPYGWSKRIVERIMADWCIADPEVSAISLRYFNPVGAHPASVIGEAPSGIPQNLMPYVAQVAGGRRERLSVFGNDYDTPDGTGVRDYIHVMDVADAHIAAVELSQTARGFEAINIGTGKGFSVMEMIRAFESASGKEIPYQVTLRRRGDVAQSFADTELAAQRLNWRAARGLEEMCQDAWQWELASGTAT